jgi:hypothetical protein
MKIIKPNRKLLALAFGLAIGVLTSVQAAATKP